MKDTSKECRNFKYYKGKHKPRCNGGKPCEACQKKFEEEQRKRG